MSAVPGGPPTPPAGPPQRVPPTLMSIRRSVPVDWDEQVDLFAIVKLDSGGFVRGWNLGAERIKGYTEDEIVGSHFSVFYREEARRRGVPDTLLAAAQRDGHVEDTGWRVRSDGREFWARVTISAIRNDQGQVLGFVKIVRDLTGEKKAADDRVAAQQAFARDLREPATALNGYLDRLADDLGTDNELVSRAREASARILDLARMLGAEPDSRAPRGRLRTTVDRVARGAVALVLPGNDPGRVAFGQMDAVPVCADDPGLRRAVADVIENAAKYSDDTIDIATYETDEGATVRVHDSGRGIHPDVLARITGEGERGRSARVTPSGPSRGLAGVQRTVGAHGGSLRISSTLGEGTTVTITLPRDEDSAPC